MPIEKPRLHHRIFFRLLLPILVVGILVATVLVTVLSTPMKSFLVREFDANLRLAATMGLRICEENFNYLLELRLEENQEMNRTLKTEALEGVKQIGVDFPFIHLLVLKPDGSLTAYHSEGVPERWSGPSLAGTHDAQMTLALGNNTIRAHVQYFPFWDWYIISFAYEADYNRPIELAYRVTYLSAASVFVAVIITLLTVFHLFIKKPLNRLVNATEGVSDGKLSTLDEVPGSEFGHLMHAFNAMVVSLDHEKSAVRDLIEQLQSIYSTLPVVVWSFDRAGIFTLSEGRALAGLGLKPGQVVGQSIFDLYKDNPVILEYAQKGIGGEACEYESEVMGKIYHTVITPVFDASGEVKWVNGLALDVTERRTAEAELRQLRNYLANIIDSMPSILIGVDKAGRVTQWNSGARRETGLTSDEATGRPLDAVFPQLADSMTPIREAVAAHRVLSKPQQAWPDEGQIRYVDLTIYPLAANEVEGAVIRVDDVTEKVRMEEIMIQSEKMLSVGGLAAGMAHEINNPLAGILQNAAVLGNRLTGDLPANHKAADTAGTTMAAIRRYLELRNLPDTIANIQNSGHMAAAIVKNMLSFARKSEGEVSSHDLGRLLDQSVELLYTDYDMKRHYDFKHITITREYADPREPVPCEASKVQQVFMNILKNGAEAMAATAHGKTPPAFVLRVQEEGAHVRVEIEDNGPGVDEKTRRRVFEPFFTTKPVGEGTGLGLSVSYFIVTEDHGGEMWVVPVEAGGTRFVIRFPKAGKKGE